MVDITTRTLRNYLASLPNGGSAGVVDKDLTIRNDLVGEAQAVPTGGLTGQVFVKLSNADNDTGWMNVAGTGDMLKFVYDPTNINASPFARANHTGTQLAATISNFSTAADARITAAIGVTVQAYDADLTAWAGVNPSSYSTTAQIAAAYQPLDADLTAIAGLTSAANKGIQFTGAGTAGTYDLTTAGKALLDDADATAQRATLGFGTGHILQSVSAEYTASTAITAVIPSDDTIPQITEGTEIITLVITPTSITNKLRARFSGMGSANGVAGLSAAIFTGATNARAATIVSVPAANYACMLICEFEYVPGALTPVTVSVRVGPSAGNGYMNGSASGRSLGGAARAVLTVEEIKA